MRRPRPEVLIGGSPIRLLRLTPAGARLVDRWAAGRPVGSGRGARALARRLLQAGLAHPGPVFRSGTQPGGLASEVARVVVPVRDDPSGLAETLESLRATAPSVEVVVVDDGSAPAVQAASARVLRRPTSGGPAAARNAGRAAGGSGPVAVFVDAGCVLTPGWLPALLRHFADPAVAAVAPRVRSRTAPPTPPDLAAYEELHSSLDMGPHPALVRPFSPVPYVPTAVLAVRLAALDAVGGFDESLRFGEDVDLVWRLAAAGWAVRYEPAAEATHPARRTRSAWLAQRFRYGESATPLAARHARAVAPVAVSPWSLAAWGLVATGHPLLGAVVAGGSAAELARRAGPDPETAWELGRLALLGHLKAGGALATGLRRAWLPAALALAAVTRARTRRRMATALLATAAGPGLTEWWKVRPPVSLSRWVGLGLADDLAYQAGVWAGAVHARSAAALLPPWDFRRRGSRVSANVGSGQVGSGPVGSGQVGSGQVGSESGIPE